MASRDFHHPYTPYPIQVEFMTDVYNALDKGKVALLESPTGTGKSLSLICGSLTWLRGLDRYKNGESEIEIADEEPDWVREQSNLRPLKDEFNRRHRLAEDIARLRNKPRDDESEHRGHRSKRRKVDAEGKSAALDDSAYLPEDVPGDGSKDTSTGLSKSTTAILERAGLISATRPDSFESLETDVQIYYTSRTHSQLSQFAHEINKLKLQHTLLGSDAPEKYGLQIPDVATPVRVLPLGARTHLCINPAVRKLGHTTAINERCLELQKPNVAQESRCPYMLNENNKEQVQDFQATVLSKIHDIEDMAEVGRDKKICPYYASRAARPLAEVVTLPYPLIIQENARQALDIDLSKHIVIVDEAHNLMDTISATYSASITLSQLRSCRSQVSTYVTKFNNKLLGRNRRTIVQLLRLIDSMISYLEGAAREPAAERIADTAKILQAKGLDQIKLHDLARYVEQSRLARKVDSYTLDTNKENEAQRDKPTPQAPVLNQVMQVLFTLAYPEDEGRFFMSSGGVEVTLRYLLLDPAEPFRKIVESARAVVLAGGTMSPMQDFVNLLFPYLSEDKFLQHSFDHIIPSSNLCVSQVTTSSGGAVFDFTFSKREQTRTVQELGLAILSFTRIVPDGLIVFFPSYSYLEKTIAAWKMPDPANKSSLWDKICNSKPAFVDSKETGVVEATLQAYTSSVSEGRGGLIISVIGGKLSEGINFSDKLGRGVIVVGLPFPNVQTAEWKVRLDYVKQKTITRLKAAGEKVQTEKGGAKPSDAEITLAGTNAAREYLENSCMRAVNQAIGRAIRHANDYAAIIVIDQRYGTERIQNKMPGWIKQSMKTGNRSVAEVEKGVKEFFAGKKEGTK